MKLNKKLKKRKGWSRLLLFTLIFSVGFCVNAQAQKITVKGIITGMQDGIPIPGVSIIEEGTNNGAVSDFDGNYSIDTKIGAVLNFRYLGMEDKAIKVTGNTISIQMSPDLEDLEEVVVVGYGTVKKKELTGAVSSVKAEDLEEIVTSDLGSAIQGQLAGVSVIADSGAPGASSEILIRGITSVIGSNSPLFVVDGLIQDGDPGISPNEIETIDVLKDAASTAIYGARGASGVILITTKQGKKGTLAIRANASYGLQVLNGEPTRLLDANQQYFTGIIRNRFILNEGVADDDIDLIGLTPNNLRNNTNLYDNIIIDSQPVTNYNVNFSGGTKDISYSVSAGLFEREGTIINSNFKRFNLRANTTYTHNNLKIRANITMQDQTTDHAPGGIVSQVLRYSPTGPSLSDFPPGETIVTGSGLSGLITQWVLESFENTRRTDLSRSQANFNVTYELFKGFILSARIGKTIQNTYVKSVNPFREIVDVFGNNLSPAISSSIANNAARRDNNTFDGVMTYKFNLNDAHDITLTSGVTFEDYKSKGFNASRSGVFDNDIQVLNNTAANPRTGSGPDFRHRITGILGRLQYSYKGKYNLSSVVRRDASSRFPTEKRAGIFPSIAAAWNVSDEPFWGSIKRTVNNFKLRASYGVVGNENLGDYRDVATISRNYNYAFGTNGGRLVGGGTQTGFANPFLVWETSIQSNLGIDLGLFKNKVTITAEYYDKTNEDMLFPVSLAGSNGAGNSQVILNLGNMTNKGFELSTRYRTKIKGLNINMTGTFSTNENKVTKIRGLGGFTFTNDSGLVQRAGNFSKATVFTEGYEAGAFFLFPTDGVLNTSEKLAEYQKLQPNARMGDLIYKDSNGDGSISDADRVYHGSGLPEFEIGYNLNLRYKGIDFSTQLFAAFGHEILNGAKASAFGFARHEDLINQWTPVNPTTPVPTFRADVRLHPNYRGDTDLWLEEGDYLRVRQMTLGYSFPKKLIEKIGFTRLRLYTSAQNPFTFTNYSGFSPEIGGRVQSRGLDKGNYPITSQYLLGLNLNF
ncbi:hypothetical protein A8C32_16925 [Flavivirga aquatica]|uniref:TonB-dependent receptor plug domain-containing protein n=1 Tax=Flavivirga aquatica TaxID=1849968 RepID=A0A1E5T8F1_9FLAO|nr:TonB-dependent receptor [Flavivirga aquatica]OEK07662.1 hypothetical protein A8C32_16925 [Flavivirga aquatica]